MELWLADLVKKMHTTMKLLMQKASQFVYEVDTVEFILTQPAQVALLGLQFQWTAEVQVLNNRIA